jgi:hypothetical protein
MSLTSTDLADIRGILKEELRPLQGKLEALSNDIKEIYGMISDLQNKTLPEKQFQKLSVEQKLLKVNSELLFAAKQAGIRLPR